ncbi:MAG: DUF2164 family protein [Fibrobacteria bacterium]|nr:DUF2164 family protein [Fibrobacteria bacterium]
MGKIDPLALTKGQRQRLVADLQAWFQDERGERLGELAASLLLDFLQEKAAGAWYDLGVQDALALVQDRSERLVDDLHVLKRGSPGLE